MFRHTLVTSQDLKQNSPECYEWFQQIHMQLWSFQNRVPIHIQPWQLYWQTKTCQATRNGNLNYFYGFLTYVTNKQKEMYYEQRPFIKIRKLDENLLHGRDYRFWKPLSFPWIEFCPFTLRCFPTDVPCHAKMIKNL